MPKLLIAALLLAAAVAAQSDAARPRGFLSWRGPAWNGTSPETGLPDKLSLDSECGSWTYDLPGRGTPVMADGRVYTLGYTGEGALLQEVLVCLDASTGKRVWEQRFSDFLSDVVYYRFSIGSPAVDPDTGNVVCTTSAGLVSCFTRDGRLLWQHSMMEEFGRLTFPNGRTGAPVIVEDQAIVHVVSTAWGPHAPAGDRFYAFDKRTGECLWSSAPEGPPKDNSFALPVVAEENGRLVLYTALGGGHFSCIDARTGDPLWLFPMTVGGMNASTVVFGDTVIAIHGTENLDDSRIGRMVAIRRGAVPDGPGPRVLGKEHEVWRADLCSFSSSPVLVQDRIYQTVATGELACIDAANGKVLWQHRLAPDQIHASPLWADGRLYVPMNNGSLHVVKPTEDGPEIVQSLTLDGNCLGAPAVCDGRVYVHTTAKLYSFGGGRGRAPAWPAAPPAGEPGPAVRLQVVPADFVARQGDTVRFSVRALDARGRVVDAAVKGASWPGLDVHDGVLAIPSDAPPRSFVQKVEANGLSGSARIRIVPKVPFVVGFDDAKASAPPPPWWVSAGGKWEHLELDGEKVLARKMDNPLFQRTMSFFGHPQMSGYTVAADILSDGNRRSMSSAGVINQRYLIHLKGNHQELEVTSNHELLKVAVPFAWQAKTWYRLKTRVDVDGDGGAVVRAKAWKRGEAEPDAWTIEVRHSHAHTHGAPGVFGFTPQSRFRVYVDNISVTPQ